MQVRALQLFLTFGKTSWDSKDLGARAGEVTLIYGGNNKRKRKANLSPLQGQSKMKMVGKPLPFSLDSTASLVSLSEPWQPPKTPYFCDAPEAVQNLFQSETESASGKPPLDFMCPRHSRVSFSRPVALLPSPSHHNPGHLFSQLGAVSKRLKFCFSPSGGCCLCQKQYKNSRKLQLASNIWSSSRGAYRSGVDCLFLRL